MLLLHDLFELPSHLAHLLQGLLVHEMVAAPLGTSLKRLFLISKKQRLRLRAVAVVAPLLVDVQEGQVVT